MNAFSHQCLRYAAWAFLALGLWSHVLASDIDRHGDAYVVYLPRNLDFDEVVDRVETEILAENWDVVDVQNIGVGVKKFGKAADNKVISVCKLQYLAQAIEDDPYVSLIIPCRFTIFREPEAGRIVVGFYDPVAEAKGLNLKRIRAAEKASEELKAVLQRIAEFYQE